MSHHCRCCHRLLDPPLVVSPDFLELKVFFQRAARYPETLYLSNMGSNTITAEVKLESEQLVSVFVLNPSSLMLNPKTTTIVQLSFVPVHNIRDAIFTFYLIVTPSVGEPIRIPVIFRAL